MHRSKWHETRLQYFEEAKYDFPSHTSSWTFIHNDPKMPNMLLECMYQSGSGSQFRNDEIARSDYKLAAVLQQLGKYEEADQYLKKSTELYRSLVGNVFIPDTNEDRYS